MRNVRYPRDDHERYHSERNAAGDTPAKHLTFDEWLKFERKILAVERNKHARS